MEPNQGFPEIVKGLKGYPKFKNQRDWQHGMNLRTNLKKMGIHRTGMGKGKFKIPKIGELTIKYLQVQSVGHEMNGSAIIRERDRWYAAIAFQRIVKRTCPKMAVGIGLEPDTPSMHVMGDGTARFIDCPDSVTAVIESILIWEFIAEDTPVKPN